jgi:hypothetical protein
MMTSKSLLHSLMVILLSVLAHYAVAQNRDAGDYKYLKETEKALEFSQKQLDKATRDHAKALDKRDKAQSNLELQEGKRGEDAAREKLKISEADLKYAEKEMNQCQKDVDKLIEKLEKRKAKMEKKKMEEQEQEEEDESDGLTIVKPLFFSNHANAAIKQ